MQKNSLTLKIDWKSYINNYRHVERRTNGLKEVGFYIDVIIQGFSMNIIAP